MSEPTFLLIGAARCGTTSMARWLDAHPDVFVTKPKEVYFFSHHRNYQKGWGYYLNLYSTAVDMLARGEATTDYANTEKYPWVVDRVADHIPNVRLIYMTRHPLERISSQWELSRSLGCTTLSLPEAVVACPELLQMSQYLLTMKAYLRRFSREQIHIVLFDDFKMNPRGQALECLRFIGVDPSTCPKDVPRSPSRANELRRPSALYLGIKNSPVTPFFREMTTPRLRGVLRYMLTRNKDWNALWDKQSFSYVRAHLERNTAEFLECYAQREPDIWRFDELR